MFIYSLSHPITNEIRYIGFTSRISLKSRLSEHLKDHRKTKKCSWIKSLLKQNLIPNINVVEICTIDNWKILEIKWIKYYRNNNFNLCNHTDGGEGTLGYKHTKLQRLNNSIRGKGRILSDEHRKKISISNKGKKRSELTKLNLSIIKTGLMHSEETKKKISQSNKGRIISEYSRKLISLKITGIKRPFKEREGKKILQFDKNMILIKEYKSLTEASLETNTLITSISNNLKNITKTSNKFIWKYKN